MTHHSKLDNASVSALAALNCNASRVYVQFRARAPRVCAYNQSTH